MGGVISDKIISHKKINTYIIIFLYFSQATSTGNPGTVPSWTLIKFAKISLHYFVFESLRGFSYDIYSAVMRILFFRIIRELSDFFVILVVIIFAFLIYCEKEQRELT